MLMGIDIRFCSKQGERERERTKKRAVKYSGTIFAPVGTCPSSLLLLLPRLLPSLCHGEELWRYGTTRLRPYFTRVESQSARCCSEVCASHCGVKGQLIHSHQLLGPGGEGDGDSQLRAVHPLDFQSDVFPIRYNPPASHYTRVHDDIIFTVLLHYIMTKSFYFVS